MYSATVSPRSIQPVFLLTVQPRAIILRRFVRARIARIARCVTNPASESNALAH